MTTESIADGLDAVARRRWSEGYEPLSAADAERILDGAALDALADAAFALGHHEKARAAHERAYTCPRRRRGHGGPDDRHRPSPG